MEAAWKGILTESERVSDVHLKVKENLCVGEIQQIKSWQKDNYHKVCIDYNNKITSIEFLQKFIEDFMYRIFLKKNSRKFRNIRKFQRVEEPENYDSKISKKCRKPSSTMFIFPKNLKNSK